MSRNYEKKLVAKHVLSGKTCDVCGKESSHRPEFDKWIYFSHQHYDWGNDSCESLEEFDVCSGECFKEKLASSLEELEGNSGSAEIFGMSYERAKEIYEVMNVQ